MGIPKTTKGQRFCVPFNCHSGCMKKGCKDAHEKLENVEGLPPETRILFFRFGGFNQLTIIGATTVDSRIAQLRESAKKNSKGKAGGKGRTRGGHAEEASQPEHPLPPGTHRQPLTTGAQAAT